MLVIVDYGVGNLYSLHSSFGFIGEDAVVSGEREVIARADRLILPGVGAFSDAAAKLRESGIGEIICEKAQKGTPIMGVCLGMQLLLEKSYEYGEHEGLGLIKGSVRYIGETIEKGLKIPHIGWNALRFENGVHPIFRDVREGDHVYFVHSYHGADCESSRIATTDYGGTLTAAVAEGSVCGCQFHPEKSGRVGLDILRAFCRWEGESE